MRTVYPFCGKGRRAYTLSNVCMEAQWTIPYATVVPGGWRIQVSVDQYSVINSPFPAFYTSHCAYLWPAQG